MTDPSTTPPLSFEQALAELEQIVTELERGETPLEATIARFERGVELARRCEDRLNEAERKVAVLLQEGSRVVEVDMETSRRLSERTDAEAPAEEPRFAPPVERFAALPTAPPPAADRPAARPPAPRPPKARPAPAARPAPSRPSPPPERRPELPPDQQMSLGSSFALKPAQEMDDDDIPF